ncbi:hypothetical protein LX64_02199 [Chitinophaga skermanii]|uniref:Phosphoribosylpyrophosphate synthetase n=1 Tax=Chitinophaga skermanii TaxID=331697 RepID=A0A327QMF2_9BACT|nr:hypothetical protein [Chitinophaga skermanii]RAJ05045.1 hypothetical protein LX64_02199 [Chitinophaga skermanii]
MDTSNRMTTLTGVLEVLKERGYDNEFRPTPGGQIECISDGKVYDASHLSIIKTYRFEGDSNPSDSAILYLVEDSKGHIGYFINAYGAYSDYEGDKVDEMIRNMKVEDREDHLLYKE